MAFTRQEAKTLCSKPELELIVASDGSALEQLSVARVQAQLKRARTLRDKYRDLERSQRLEASGKPSPRRRMPRSEGAVRTARKAEIFDVVVARFQARAAELELEVAQGKRLAEPPAAPSEAEAPRAADPPPGQSKTGHRRSRRRTVQQSLDATPTDDTEALEELQLPKGTRSAQRRLARKPPKKKPAKKAASKTAAAKTTSTKKKAASKKATTKKASSKKAASKKAASKKASSKKASSKKAASKKAASKKAASKKAASKKATTKKAASKKASSKKAASKKASSKKASSKKKAPAKKAPGKKAPAKKAPGQKAPAERAPGKKRTAKKRAAKKSGAAAGGTKRRGGAKAKKSSVAPVSLDKRNRVKAHSIKQMSHGKAAGRRSQARRDRKR